MINETANVVVSVVTLIPSWVGTPPPHGPFGYAYVAPCGGSAEVRAQVNHAEGADLALAIDTSGVLDQSYPTGNPPAEEAGMFNLSPIWTNGQLKGGEWITVRSDGVSLSASEPTAAARASCAPWTYSEPR